MTIHNYRLGCLGVDLFRGNAVCTACVGRSPLQGVIHGCYRDSRALSAVAAVEIVVHPTSIVARPGQPLRRSLGVHGGPIGRHRCSGRPTHRQAALHSRSGRTNSSTLQLGRRALHRPARPRARACERCCAAWERYVDRDDHTTSRLTVIGDGPLASEAREAARRGISFTGWLSPDEVRARLLTARAFVFPSEWYEPFGMVLIEAMAAGLPIVATTASDAARITGTPDHLIAPAG